MYTTLIAVGTTGILACLAAQYLTRNMNNSFVTRLISGILLVLAALLTIIPGGLPLLLISLFLSIVAYRELLRAFNAIRAKENNGEMKNVYMPEIIGYAGIALFYIALWTNVPNLENAMLVLCFLVLLFGYVFQWPGYNVQIAVNVFFAVFYAGFLLSCVCQTRMLPYGHTLVWLIFLASWGSDTCAYCTGMLIGKHKMTPKLSPKKTIEGGIGGVVGATLLCVIYSLFIEKAMPIWGYALCGCLGAMLSMVGDLAASAIKRDAGIKDYGKLIPGHGGVMDRFDSVIVTAPVIYYLALLLA